MGHAVADVIDALEGGDDLFVVGDDDDGGLVALGHVAQDADHRQRAHAVERRSGLIGEDHRRTVDQAAGDGHALLLAAGELRGHGLGAVLHVERGEQFQRTLARFAVGFASEHGQQRDVVGDVEEGNEIRRLEHEADLVAAQGAQVANLPAVVVDHLVAQSHAPGGRLDHRAQTLQQGALARARGADQPDHFTRRDLHVHALERVHRGVAAAVALFQAFDADASACHGQPPIASAGSTLSAMRMATRLASAQITITAKNPAMESPGMSSTNLGNSGAAKVAVILPTAKPIRPSASACCMIMAAMVRLRVPMSLSTAISRILSMVSV